MKLILLVFVVAAVCADDPITVDPSGGGGGGLPPQIQGTGLTMDFCNVADTECSGSDLSSKFAPATSECLKRCGRSPDCLSAFYDSNKVCHLRGNRCDVDARNASPGATYLHRLKDGESCPADTPEYFSTIPKYSNRFCVVEGKACSGHNMYKKPQKIPEFIDCLRKCVGVNECAMVDFFDGQCELKNHACTDDELVDTAGTDNYVRLDEATLTCPFNRKVPDETLVPQPEPEPEPKPEVVCTRPDSIGPSVDGDDNISEASCPSDLFVMHCLCVPDSPEGYCDGTTIKADGKTCRAHAASGGGPVKAHVCCEEIYSQFYVASNPPIMAAEGKSIGERAGQYTEPASVSCPYPGTEMFACALHTYWSHEYPRSALYKQVHNPNDGTSTCSAPRNCPKCGVQALCTEIECYRELNPEGDTVNGDDAISVAKCPGSSVVANCRCTPQTDHGYFNANGYCDGVTITADLKECHAHAASGGGPVKADVCCSEDLKDLSLVSNPPIMAETGKSIPERAAQYTGRAEVECAEGEHVHACFLHTFWSHEYDKTLVRALVVGRKCIPPETCLKCGVQAICVKADG